MTTPITTTPPTSAHKRYEVHYLAKIFPEIEGRTFEAFKEDIKERGQIEPAWLYEDKILEGKNRQRACERLGIELKTREYVGNDPIGFVLSANLHRRQLDESQRAMVAARLATLELGTNQYSKEMGVSIDTASKMLNVGRASVARAKKVLASGNRQLIEDVDKGTKAVSDAANQATPQEQSQEQPNTSKSKKGGKRGKGKGKQEKETVEIKYQKPTNTKGALSVCNTLTQHLLDALEDLSELSSFDHAEVFAGQIKEAIDRKIGEMRPEEETEEEEQAAA